MTAWLVGYMCLPRTNHTNVRLLALLVANLSLAFLEDVDYLSAQLRIKIEVVEMRVLLLFLHDLLQRVI